ncbi:PAS domain S-box protein [Demequina capsici]|uniref:histidine kinase n=1 Tax=Demequina capsici TaxID=3075620 RepID=A0AA96FEU2_9MICO|nr:PAS domain S-box protein [Demequina sp. PMTSA13]WNM28219.1 PAS domain S-box protein [Demequina sp. PMTSA13]
MAPSAEGGTAGPSTQDPRRGTAVSARTGIRPTAVRPHPAVIAILINAALLAILLTDLWLPRGYDISSMYALVVLASAFTRSRLAVYLTGATATVIAASMMTSELSNSAYDRGPVAFSHLTAIVLIVLSGAASLLALRRTEENARLVVALRSAEHAHERDSRMLDTASLIAPIGTWTFDPEAQTVTWHERAAEIVEGRPFTPTDVDTALGLIAEDERTRVLSTFTAALETGSPFREEFEFTGGSGTLKRVVIMGDPLQMDEHGRTLVHGSVQDITRWAAAESELERTRRRFAALTAAVPFAVWSAGADGQIEYANEAMRTFTGAGPEAGQGEHWKSMIHPDDRDRVSEAWETSIRTGATYDIEHRYRRADGEYEWFHVSAEPERDEDGTVIRWWGATVNVDSTRELRQRAEDLAAERATILESTTDGVYAVDREWRILYANSAAKAMIDRLSVDVVGEEFWSVFGFEPDREASEQLQIAMSTGTPSSFTYFSEALNRWFSVTATPTRSGLSVFHRDVTEIHRLSEQLSQAQKLESVGRLTGGIAHDFNNVLTVVLGGAEAVVNDPAVGHEAREMAELVVESAKRGADLTARLLSFARKQPLSPSAVDLEDRLSGLAPMLKRTLGELVELIIVPSVGLPAIMVDSGQFDNALLNLVLNARDAMPDGGRLTIGATEAELDADYCATHAEATPGHYVMIDVSDTGHGIGPEEVERLFEPFFTTKATGKGSGLGLAMVWGFVKQSGGYISAYSEAGVGTTFKLYLPPSVTPAVQLVNGLPPLRPIRPATILLAEDDDLVRAFATERLRSLGHTVHAAPSGPEALALLDTVGPVDLLFTDVIMPDGMTGRDLAEEFLRRRPDTPVLFTSGYTENVVLHNGRLDDGVLLLTKPYTAEQLTERITTALDRAEPPA